MPQAGRLAWGALVAFWTDSSFLNSSLAASGSHLGMHRAREDLEVLPLPLLGALSVSPSSYPLLICLFLPASCLWVRSPLFPLHLSTLFASSVCQSLLSSPGITHSLLLLASPTSLLSFPSSSLSLLLCLSVCLVFPSWSVPLLLLLPLPSPFSCPGLPVSRLGCHTFYLPRSLPASLPLRGKS